MIAVLFWLLILGISTFGILPIWTKMIEGKYYGYLPYLLCMLLVLVVIRLGRVAFPKSVFGWLVIAIGAVAFGASFQWQLPWLAAASWVCFVVAFLASGQSRVYSSQSLFKPLSGSLVGLIPLAILALPIPGSVDHTIDRIVRSQSANWSSIVLDMVSIPNLWQAGGLKLETSLLPRSDLFPFGFAPLLCGFYLILVQVLRHRSPWLFPVYYAVGLTISLIANSLWTCSVVIAQESFGINLLIEWPVIIASILAGLFAFLLALSLDRFLLVSFFQTRPEDLNDWNNPLISVWNRLFSPDPLS